MLKIGRLINKLKNIRTYHFLWQKITRGFDDSETFSLDYSLAKLIAPRLKRFQQISIAYPSEFSDLEWNCILNKMISSFEFLASEDRWTCSDKKKWKEVQEGLDLFSKYYLCIWW
jgi:hypothetical protein